MALDSAELVQYARDSASRGDDLFALLGVDATTPKDDIHRAWRRAGLKYHPDKAGADYDPAKYESFERARDVLCDPAAREAYDNAVRAALQKKRRVDEMSADRRRFVEELERAEREAKRQKTEAEGGGLTQAERSRVAEAGRRRMEERARLMREAEERSRQREKEDSGAASASRATTTEASLGGDERAPPTPTTPASARAEAQTSNGASTPSGKTTKHTGEDGYDDRIANLERRLREKQEKKAAKKTGKKSRKSDISSLSSGLTATSDETPTKPNSDGIPGSKADGDGIPERRAFSFKPYSASAPSSPATKSTSNGNSLPQFATTMARLKAAQAKREEEKRRRSEASHEQTA